MTFILTCENCRDTIVLAENLVECDCGLCCGELVEERPQISGGKLEVE
jgi:hypothetical protein